MFKKRAKKYICSECDSIVEIKIISNDSDEHTKIQFCPFCADYLDEDSNKKHEAGPLLKDFDDYDEFDDDKYYSDDLDDSDD